MTKKHEKSNKVHSPSSVNSDTQETEFTKENGRKMYEKYHTTGEFEKDFTELCSFLGIQLTVAHRTKVPVTPTPPLENKKNTHDTTKLTENKEVQPATHNMPKDECEYFKPHIDLVSDVELNNKEYYIKELYIRGWKVDMRVIGVLSRTLQQLEKLTFIDMWNAGLTNETLNSLGQCLQTSTSLKTLRLDGNNNVTDQRFDIFLTQPSKLSLHNLSLRNCNLTETGAFYLGDALLYNKSLLTLNLCFNKLGDAGAHHLAKFLRINRTLLSLNIGSNGINDEGAKHISDALSSFPLTHEQVVARRMQMTLDFKEKFKPPSTPSPVERSPSERSQREKSARRESGRGKESKRDKSNSDTLKVQKGQKQKGSSKADRNKSPHPDVDDTNGFKDPLLEDVREVDGELWISGNRSLINLNLSRNRISNIGLELLYSAVKFQVNLSLENTRVMIRTGLMRLCLQKNCFSLDDSTYIALHKLMERRDPMRKSSVTEPVE